MPAPRKYDQETQDRAVRMYADRIAAGDVSQRQARIEVGELLGIKAETLRNWIRRDLGEAGRPAAAVAGPADVELARLRWENARLRRAKRDLEDRLSVSRAGGARPQTRVVVDYIETHRDRFGADLHRAGRARLVDRPIDLLRPPRPAPAAFATGSSDLPRVPFRFGQHDSNRRATMSPPQSGEVCVSSIRPTPSTFRPGPRSAPPDPRQLCQDPPAELSTIRAPEALPGWLKTTTRNECLRVLAVHKRTPFYLDDSILHERADEQGDQAAIDAELLAAERRAVLRECLAQLKPKCRDLLSALSRDDRRPYGEVSSDLGMPLGSIGPTRQRCLEKLRNCPALRRWASLDDNDEGGDPSV